MHRQIQQYIKLWQGRCYPELPDEAPREIDDKVPSYRRIAMCILKNDLRGIGVEPPRSEYYNQFKRIEIEARNNKKPVKTLFDI